MPHADKLEGKRKVQCLVLALGLALVLFFNTWMNGDRETPPKNISEFHVGQNVSWRETTMECTLTVFNIYGVVPPAVEDVNMHEDEKLCGALECKPTTPLVKSGYKERYTCYSLKNIISRF